MKMNCWSHTFLLQYQIKTVKSVDCSHLCLKPTKVQDLFDILDLTPESRELWKVNHFVQAQFFQVTFETKVGLDNF